MVDHEKLESNAVEASRGTSLLDSRPAWEREVTPEARAAKLDEALERFIKINAPVWEGVNLEEYMNEIRERD